jgi:hypothetical protein
MWDITATGDPRAVHLQTSAPHLIGAAPEDGSGEVAKLTSNQVLRRLERAHAVNDLVRVSRRGSRWDRRDGYVVAVSCKWLLLAVIDDRVRPDGVSAVRVDDIESVVVAKNQDRFVRQHLELHQAWPPNWATVAPLDKTRHLIESLGSTHPIVAVFIEDEDPNVCFIGRPERITARAVHLREVTPQAEWRRGSKWTFGRITRLDAGGGYEEALAEVAGPPPSRTVLRFE